MAVDSIMSSRINISICIHFILYYFEIFSRLRFRFQYKHLSFSGLHYYSLVNSPIPRSFQKRSLSFLWFLLFFTIYIIYIFYIIYFIDFIIIDLIIIDFIIIDLIIIDFIHFVHFFPFVDLACPNISVFGKHRAPSDILRGIMTNQF